MATVRIQVRRGTAADWASIHPTLAAGEVGFESDTRKMKVGDGTSNWNQLDYIASDAPAISEIAEDAIYGALTLGSGLSKSYDDALNKITLNNTGVLSFNTRTGAVTLSGTDITDALGYTPADAADLSSLSGQTASDITDAITTAELYADGLIAALTKSSVGLGNVNNTSDANKPISTNTQTALDAKAPLASPALTGTPTAPTATAGTNTTQVATTAFVGTAVANLVGTASSTLDTLGEIATALGNDANLSTTLTSAIGLKAPIDSPTFTGTVSLPANTITNTMMADDSVDTAEIKDSAVTSAKIANGTIVNADINASAAIALSKLATDPLARANHTGTQAASTISDFTEAAQDAVGGMLGTGLTYNDAANTITVDTTNIQLRVTGVSDTEIGYLDGVTSSVQTQLDNKSTASKTETLTNKTLTSPVINTPTGITKSDVGLANVDNTSDVNKPISTNTQTALNLKAPIDSPTFTGTVTLPTGTVSSTMILNGTIVAEDLADGAITSSKILDGTIVNADINASAEIAKTKIAGTAVTQADTGTVTSSMILDGTIVNNDISSSAAITDSKLATISTSGKVSNSATTATDANTASAIVARDASGNFTANLITINETPTANGHAVSKAYVDNVAAGMNWHEAVQAASVQSTGMIYNNGTSGVGATLTSDTNRVLTSIDGFIVSLHDRILIKDQTDAKQNGIYTITSMGSSSTPFVLTRASDSNNSTPDQVKQGDAVYVVNGSENGNQAFVETGTGTGDNNAINIGTDLIIWTQFTGAASLVAGNGLTRTGNSVDVVSSTLTVAANSVDLSTVSRSNTTGAATNNLISAITTDSYGRVTAVASSPINVATSSQQGVATFNTTSFTVTSGDVTIKSAGVSNTQLVNSSITIGSTPVSLGSSATTVAGLTLTSPTISQINNTGVLTLPISTDTLVGRATTDTLSNKTISGSTNTLSSIPNSALTNSSISVNGNSISLGGSVSGLATNASPTFTGTVTLPLTTAGYVTTTSGGVISSVATIPNVGLTNSSVTVGTTAIALGASSTTLAGLTSVTSTGFTGALTGNVAGNASTATALATPRNINGVAFDGSAAITVKASTTNALTIGTGLSGSSFDGSGAVTIAIDSTVATLTGSQTLTNKTITSPSIGSATLTGTLTAGGGVGTNGQYLQSTATGVQWSTVPAGYNAPTIGSTSIASGATVTTISGLSLSNAATITTTGDVTIGGNLTVNGTTTTVNSTTLAVSDNNIEIAKVASPTDVTANGAGITIKGATDKTFNWYSSTSALTSSENMDLASGKTYKIAGNDVLTATRVLGKGFSTTAGDIALIDGSQTLTNKTISGASNTLTNISNTSLTNSSVTVNGTSISLGSSGTIKASTTNALTIGTGLSGTSFDGSGAVTVAIDSTVTTLTGSQTLTNKTLTAPIITVATSAQTASYTLVLTDANKIVEVNNASANNLTVPLNSSVAYPVGTTIDILQTGAGQTTIVATGGVTINGTPGLKLRAQWSSATLIKRATDTWVLIGDLSA